MEEANKTNIIKAMAGVLPIIQVQSNDDLTTALIRFSLNTFQTDIVNLANGSASEEIITSYTSDILNYIADDQGIDSNEITPDITAFADNAEVEEDSSVTINVVANDSYITTAPISVTASNGSNGVTSVTGSSPEQVIYTPSDDFNGTDAFSYTITQGNKTSSADVTVNIAASNDAPSIDIASTIQAEENQTTVATVSISDVDGDDLTLSMGGADANSFNLSTDNVLTFKEPPDYETKSTYLITFSLTDGTETVTKDVTIVITNTNDNAPEITSSPSFSVDENISTIGTVSATDIDGDTLTFIVRDEFGSNCSLGGGRTWLEINQDGLLSFIYPEGADYEVKSLYEGCAVSYTHLTLPTKA